MDALGFPVMGDPRYGRGNKNTEGMRLAAMGLGFRDPVTGERVRFELGGVELGFRTPGIGDRESA